jgi:hypothetical protein
MRRKGWGAARFTLFFFVWFGCGQDVGKKKVASKCGAFEEKEATEKNEAVEQVAERNAGTEEIAGPAAKRQKAKRQKKKRPVRCIQRHTDVEFRREFPKVFNALVKKAKKGGTAETRLLLQIGKFGDAKAAKRRGAKSLSEMLLDELKRRQDEREAAADEEARSNEASSEGATSGGDADNR